MIISFIGVRNDRIGLLQLLLLPPFGIAAGFCWVVDDFSVPIQCFWPIVPLNSTAMANHSPIYFILSKRIHFFVQWTFGQEWALDGKVHANDSSGRPSGNIDQQTHCPHLWFV